MKMLAWALWTLSAVGVTCGVDLGGDDELCQTHSNGCSVPSWLQISCKEHFRKACDRHDTCYLCGATFEITREQCDLEFHADMIQLCEESAVDGQCSDRRRRDVSSSSSSSSSPFRPQRHLMASLKPLSTRDSKQQHARAGTCVESADSYLWGVQTFGASQYSSTVDLETCDGYQPCLPEM